jgi:hypothetical protein
VTYRINLGGGLIFSLFLMHLLLIAFATGESSTSELFLATSLLLVGASVADESSTQEEGAECGKERPHCEESREGFFFSRFSTAGGRVMIDCIVERGGE